MLLIARQLSDYSLLMRDEVIKLLSMSPDAVINVDEELALVILAR